MRAAGHRRGGGRDGRASRRAWRPSGFVFVRRLLGFSVLPPSSEFAGESGRRRRVGGRSARRAGAGRRRRARRPRTGRRRTDRRQRQAAERAGGQVAVVRWDCCVQFSGSAPIPLWDVPCREAVYCTHLCAPGKFREVRRALRERVRMPIRCRGGRRARFSPPCRYDGRDSSARARTECPIRPSDVATALAGLRSTSLHGAVVYGGTTMGFASGTVSFRRFVVRRGFPKAADQAVLDALAATRPQARRVRRAGGSRVRLGRRAARPRRHFLLRAQRLRRRPALRPADRHQQGARRPEEGVPDHGGGSRRLQQPLRLHQQGAEEGRQGDDPQEGRGGHALGQVPPEQAAAGAVGPAVADGLLPGQRGELREAGRAVRADVQAEAAAGHGRLAGACGCWSRAAGGATTKTSSPPASPRAPAARASTPNTRGSPRGRSRRTSSATSSSCGSGTRPTTAAASSPPEATARPGGGRRHGLHRPLAGPGLRLRPDRQGLPQGRRPQPDARGPRRPAHRQDAAQGRAGPRRQPPAVQL